MENLESKNVKTILFHHPENYGNFETWFNSNKEKPNWGNLILWQNVLKIYFRGFLHQKL